MSSLSLHDIVRVYILSECDLAHSSSTVWYGGLGLGSVKVG